MGNMAWCCLVAAVYILTSTAALKVENVYVPASTANVRRGLVYHQDKPSQGHGTLEASVKKQNKNIIYRKNKVDKEAEKEIELMAEITRIEAKKQSKTKHKNNAKQRPGSKAASGESSRPQPCCQQGQGCSSCKEEQRVPELYSPSWRSLDRRPIPSWYEDAKFGVFVHWGVYSVPSFRNEWFWYHWKEDRWAEYLDFMDKNYPPGFSYAEFAPKFKAELFDANEWAQLVAKSGARYFVFTSKHHDGFANWNSSAAWNWNSVDTGPHMDIVEKLARAIKGVGVRFGLYYSLYEWFNPLYRFDKRNGFLTDEFIRTVVDPQLYELVTIYKPDIIWSDGDWEAPDTYWKSREFLSWLYNDSPIRDSVVVNDRWGAGCRCRHGGFFNCADRYNPGELKLHKWENALTIDKSSWGYRRGTNLEDFLSIEELIKELVTTVSCGGNMLLNVGPAADGTISPIFQERLLQIGDWLTVNGEAIYSSRPWRVQNDSINSDVWYTSKDEVVYAIILKWPGSGQWQGLDLGEPIPTQETEVSMLGLGRRIVWEPIVFDADQDDGIYIELPLLTVSELPCQWAWVIRLNNVR